MKTLAKPSDSRHLERPGTSTLGMKAVYLEKRAGPDSLVWGEKRDFSTIRAASTTDLIGRSGTGACRVTAFAIELFDCQFQKRFRQATDS